MPKNSYQQEKTRSKRIPYTKEQRIVLGMIYKEENNPNTKFREKISRIFNRTPRSIQVWFQNKRSQEAKKQRRREKLLKLWRTNSVFLRNTIDVEFSDFEEMTKIEQLQKKSFQMNLHEKDLLFRILLVYNNIATTTTTTQHISTPHNRKYSPVMAMNSTTNSMSTIAAQKIEKMEYYRIDFDAFDIHKVVVLNDEKSLEQQVNLQQSSSSSSSSSSSAFFGYRHADKIINNDGNGNSISDNISDSNDNHGNDNVNTTSIDLNDDCDDFNSYWNKEELAKEFYSANDYNYGIDSIKPTDIFDDNEFMSNNNNNNNKNLKTMLQSEKQENLEEEDKKIQKNPKEFKKRVRLYLLRSPRFMNFIESHKFIGIQEGWYNTEDFSKDFHICVNNYLTLEFDNLKDWIKFMDYTKKTLDLVNISKNITYPREIKNDNNT